MGLLDALKLPAAPKPAVVTGGAAADLGQAFESAKTYARDIEDPGAKGRFAAALVAFDRERKAAEKQTDPARRAAASAQALKALDEARAEAGRGGPSAARKAADAAKGELQASYRKAADAHERLLARQKELAAELAEAKATTRDDAPQRRIAQLQAANKAEVEAAGKLRDRLYADIETLGRDDASDAELAAVVARRDAKADVAAVTTLEREDGLLSRKGTETTTRVAGGKADVRRTTTEYGLGAQGATASRRDEREQTSAGGTHRRSQEVSGSVSAKGLAADGATSSTFEDNEGNTFGVERKAGVQIGPKGAEVTAGKTVTKRDGSAQSLQVTGKTERGEGEVKVTQAAQYAKTDAGGDKTDTFGASSSKKLIAGEDGYGVGAENTGSFKRERKNGVQSGASLTFGGNVTCQVGEPDDKRIYPVTLKVDFAAGLALDGGYDKRKSDKKAVVAASVSASIKKSGAMIVVQLVPEAKLDAYAAAAKAARSGGKLDATWKELAILHTGAKQGWVAAWEMWSGGGVEGSLGEAEGSSVEVQTGTERTAGASGSVKAVNASIEGRDQQGSRTRLERKKGGAVGVDTEDTQGAGVSGSAGVDAGAAGVAFRHGVAMSTSIGYSITIEKANDPDGKLLKAFLACRTPAAQEAFLRENGKRVTLEAITRGSSEEASSGVNFKVAGADLDLGSSGKLDRRVQTGADGKLKKSKVVGSQSKGGSAGVGDFLRAADSTRDTATASRDDQGKVDLDLQRDRSSSDFKAKVAQKLGLGDEEAPAEGGLLAAAAGRKEASTDVHMVSGVRFGKADMARVVDLAGKAFDWNHLADDAGDRATAMAWMALGRKIASLGGKDPGLVADELAAFVGGGDKGRRMDIVMRVARAQGAAAIGRRSEFPKSLAGEAKAYDELILGGVADALEKKAGAEGPQAAAAWGQAQLQRMFRLLNAVIGCKDFASPSTKAEMLANINERRQELLDQVARLGGTAGNEAAADAGDLRAYKRLRLQVSQYPELAQPILGELKGMVRSDKRIIGGNRNKALPMLEELEHLYAVWERTYAQLEQHGHKSGQKPDDWTPFKPDKREYQLYYDAVR